MPNLPLFNEIRQPGAVQLQRDSHAGLWFERFYDGYDANWETDQARTRQQQWLNELVHSSRGDADLMTQQAQALQRRVSALGGECRDIKAQGHFVTGMGLSHPLENGMAWHPTLGAPYLNGAAVKGLLRAFFEQWTEMPLEQIRQWFGYDGDKKKLTGDFIFFDALPLQPVKLEVDVMTPHYGDWYAQGGSITGTAGDNVSKLPADWHNPIPISFLVTKDIKLRFALAPRKPDKVDSEALHTLLEGLVYALEWLGAGAKTAAGYGRMTIDQQAEDRRKQDEAKRIQEQQAAEKERQQALAEAAENKRLSQLDPLDLKIEAVFHNAADKSLPNWQKLHQSLTPKNEWAEAERPIVAARIRSMMEAAGVWVPDEKSKKGERSRQILPFLEN